MATSGRWGCETHLATSGRWGEGVRSALVAVIIFGLAIGPVKNSGAKALEPATPESVGMDSTALAAMKAEMQGLIDNKIRAGVVYAVARNNKLIALEAMGSRDLEKNLPMTPDTIFRIASMTRVLSGATILTLLEEGKVHMDDPVSKYIPEFADTPVIKETDGDTVTTEPQKTPLTLRHLWTYTAGFGYQPPKGYGDGKPTFDPDATLGEGVLRLAKIPLLYQPGAHWHYGSPGDVLGRVAEIVSHERIDAFLRERMLDKLGMKDTHYTIPEQDQGRLAEVYGPKDGNPLANISDRFKTMGNYLKPGPLLTAGGGLASTVPDYMRFAQMLLNGGELDGVRVLKASTVKMMLTRQTTPEQGLVYWYDPPTAFHNVKGYAWGLAIGIRAPEAEHVVPGSPGDATWAGVINTVFFVDPKTKIVAVAMSQYAGVDEPAMTQVFRKGVYAAIKK